MSLFHLKMHPMDALSAAKIVASAQKLAKASYVLTWQDLTSAQVTADQIRMQQSYCTAVTTLVLAFLMSLLVEFFDGHKTHS